MAIRNIFCPFDFSILKSDKELNDDNKIYLKVLIHTIE